MFVRRLSRVSVYLAASAERKKKCEEQEVTTWYMNRVESIVSLQNLE